MNSEKFKDSLRMVKQWILEHACKFQMDKVISAVFRKGTDTLLNWNDVSEITVNPAFMFVTIVESFQRMLQVYIENTDKLTWDNSLIDLIINLLEDLYKENHFVSFKLFINVITRLKVMELLQLMNDGKESTEIVLLLNKRFPHWDKKTQRHIQKTFNILNIISLKKAEKAIVTCRRFILQLLVNDVRWKNYLKDSYTQDMKNFATVITKELKEILNILRPKLPPSPIEQIISGTNDDLSNSTDPIVQMLLEHLHCSMNQNDFLSLLTSLEPETDSQINPMPLAHILDAFSDSGSVEGSQNKNEIDSDTETIAIHSDISDTEVEVQHTPVKKPKTDSDTVMTPINQETEKEICDWDDIVSPSDDEPSNESHTFQAPNLEHYLAVNCGKPCIVKLHEYMIKKIDGIKYEIYS